MGHTTNRLFPSSQVNSLTVYQSKFPDFVFSWVDLGATSIMLFPGKNLNMGDSLSQAPLTSTVDDQDLEELADISAHMEQIQANKEMEYCCKGWPDRNKLTQELQPYWSERGELTIGEDPLLHGSHVVVPVQMQSETKRTQASFSMQRFFAVGASKLK